MKAALIVGDEKSRQVADPLPEDFQHGVCGAVSKGGVGLAIAFADFGNRKTRHSDLRGSHEYNTTRWIHLASHLLIREDRKLFRVTAVCFPPRLNDALFDWLGERPFGIAAEQQ